MHSLHAGSLERETFLLPEVAHTGTRCQLKRVALGTSLLATGERLQFLLDWKEQGQKCPPTTSSLSSSLSVNLTPWQAGSGDLQQEIRGLLPILLRQVGLHVEEDILPLLNVGGQLLDELRLLLAGMALVPVMGVMLRPW